MAEILEGPDSPLRGRHQIIGLHGEEAWALVIADPLNLAFYQGVVFALPPGTIGSGPTVEHPPEFEFAERVDHLHLVEHTGCHPAANLGDLLVIAGARGFRCDFGVVAQKRLHRSRDLVEALPLNQGNDVVWFVLIALPGSVDPRFPLLQPSRAAPRPSLMTGLVVLEVLPDAMDQLDLFLVAQGDLKGFRHASRLGYRRRDGAS